MPNWASAEAQFIPNCSLAAPQIFQIFSNFLKFSKFSQIFQIFSNFSKFSQIFCCCSPCHRGKGKMEKKTNTVENTQIQRQKYKNTNTKYKDKYNRLTAEPLLSNSPHCFVKASRHRHHQTGHHYPSRPKKTNFPKIAQNNVNFFLLPSTTMYQCVLL